MAEKENDDLITFAHEPGDTIDFSCSDRPQARPMNETQQNAAPKADRPTPPPPPPAPKK